jgi:protein-S-isoprenylcysteine O-methyltransferase Ste14
LILFTIPSISFLFDSFIVLLCSILAFVLFKLLIKREEIFLEEKFGEEYRIYKKNVGQLFPKIKNKS